MADGGLLAVRGLTVRYAGAPGPVFADLDLDLAAGECLAVVGPSGCGKSTLCRALLDLLPAGARLAGSIRWQGVELTADRAHWHRQRGAGVGLLLQDHRFALDPVRRVGDQIAEVARRRRPQLSRDAAREAVRALLAEVRLPEPEQLARRFPHQLSGGQRQRACLAAALAASPRLLLADEPTTALDLIVQRDIIALMRDLVASRGLGLLLVTHDRDLVPAIASRTLVWPQTEAPPVAAPPPRPWRAVPDPCVRVRGLSVAVAAAGGGRRAVVQDVDLDLAPGWTLGLVGESGAGKTTLARALAGWLPSCAGSIGWAGAGAMAPRARLRAVQMVSQDPTAALDPRQRVVDAVIEAARASGDAPDVASARARALLREVDLDPALLRRRPDALSGGQRQRVQVARALAARPRVLVADEPASSLDPARRRRLLELLRRLQEQHGLALLLISHDLAWLQDWCDQVAVLHAGRIVEVYRPAGADQPRHPLTRDLAAAAYRASPPGSAAPASPAPLAPPAGADPSRGCPYASRCRLVEAACRSALPDLRDRGDGHRLRCPPADRQAR